MGGMSSKRATPTPQPPPERTGVGSFDDIQQSFSHARRDEANPSGDAATPDLRLVKRRWRFWGLGRRRREANLAGKPERPSKPLKVREVVLAPRLAQAGGDGPGDGQTDGPRATAHAAQPARPRAGAQSSASASAGAGPHRLLPSGADSVARRPAANAAAAAIPAAAAPDAAEAAIARAAAIAKARQSAASMSRMVATDAASAVHRRGASSSSASSSSLLAGGGGGGGGGSSGGGSGGSGGSGGVREHQKRFRDYEEQVPRTTHYLLLSMRSR